MVIFHSQMLVHQRVIGISQKARLQDNYWQILAPRRRTNGNLADLRFGSRKVMRAAIEMDPQ